MEISQKQTSLFTEDKSTSLPEVSPVSHTQWQENEKGKKMIDTSGRRCLDQLERFNRVGSWGRMFLALLIGQEGWYSTKCKLTWKLRGTKYSRLYCQLAVSTLPIKEKGFGLLLTPSTVDIGITEGRVEKRTVYRESVGRHYVPECLTEQLQGLLPTPCANDIQSSQEERIIQKNGRFVKKNKQSGTEYGPKLVDVAGLLPTPVTRDYKGARTTEALKNAGRNETNNLPDAFAQTGKSSQLNPRFVAEMMGFPPNWTELPFLNGETNQSKHTVTQ